MAGLIVWAAFLALIFMPGGAVAADAPPAKRVLMLFSEGKDLPADVLVERGAKEELQQLSKDRIEFYAEYLDAGRFPSESYYRFFREYLREKYADRQPDLILAFLARGFGLAGELPAEVFPNASVVFVSMNELVLPSQLKLPRTTGIVQRFDFEGTYNLIRTLQPKTNHIIVIGGVSPMDQMFLGRAKEVANTQPGGVRFEFWSDRPVSALKDQVSQLPEGTVLCLSTVFRDSANQGFHPEQVARILAPAASVPVYGFADTFLGSGVVGGAVVDFLEVGRSAGHLGAQILGGTPASDLPIEIRSSNPVILDARALNRWGISDSRLPAGSVLLYREHTLWEDNKGLILSAIAVMSAQMLTIAALLLNRAKRRRSEEALRTSEQRVNLAADAANLGLWVLDLRQDDIWATERCRSLFGFSADEKISFATFAARVHPDDREAMEQAVKRAIELQGSFEAEYRACLPSGDVRWIGARGVATGNGGGVAGSLLGVCIDLTEQKRTDDELNRQRAELAHVSRVSIMGELSASIAHELNQPLTAILTNSRAAQRFMAADKVDMVEIGEILQDIAADTTRARDVIRHLRSLVRRSEPEFSRLDVGDTIREVVGLLHGDIVSRNVKVRLELLSDLPPVHGDRIQVQQILINLLLNAFDAMGTIPVPERLATVEAVMESDHAIRVSVRDTGTGIPPDKLGSIFEPFFTTKREGMGMGLSVSRSIVETHGGRLWAENNRDRGATISFTLPVDR